MSKQTQTFRFQLEELVVHTDITPIEVRADSFEQAVAKIQEYFTGGRHDNPDVTEGCVEDSVYEQSLEPNEEYKVTQSVWSANGAGNIYWNNKIGAINIEEAQPC